MKNRTDVSVLTGIFITFGITAILASTAIQATPSRLAAVRPALTVKSLGARPEPPGTPPKVIAHPRLDETYGGLPLTFEVNRGQTDPRVDFISRGAGYALFLTRGESVLCLRAPQGRTTPDRIGPRLQSGAVLRIRIVDGNPTAHVSAREELTGKANYLIGNDPNRWRVGIPTFGRIVYEDIYRGVDLVYRGNQRHIEFDFIVRPGANVETIELAFEGAERLEVDANGDLVLRLAGGELRQRKPFIYQELDGVRRQVAGGYAIKGANRVGFRVSHYDRSSALVIDPTLFYSTYLGGDQSDAGRAIAVDSSGNAYVTGETLSSDFPTTAGALDATFNGGEVFGDAFVTKLNPTGSGLVFSTYLGGTGGDQGLGIAVDSSVAPDVFVTGRTDSSDFPTTPTAFDTSFNGDTDDAFVTRLNSTGSALVYSTYLGGKAQDIGNSIALDTSSNAYVTGTTISSDFPTTLGAFDTILNNGDVFVTKLNSAGSAPLLYSTFIGGDGNDFGQGIALDALQEAYVTGGTGSANFPTTTVAFDTTFNGGGFDAFVTKLNSSGSALIYSTYLGGTNADFGFGIAVDSGNSAYVTGQTESTDFPVTTIAFDTSLGGSLDGFVTKVDVAGSTLVYSTFLGGSSNDVGIGIAVDTSFNAYVTGATLSTDFPTADSIQASSAGSFDAFVTKFDATGSALVYSTYLGGAGSDQGAGIALDALPTPNAYVVGFTGSADFPTTGGAFDTTYNGGTSDAFVAKIAVVTVPPPPTVGKVTGGGSIEIPGGIGTFGFIVQRKTADGPISGELQYVRHSTDSTDRIHSVTFLTFGVAGNTATFSGACTNNGSPCTFSVDVTDNDEPGFDDTFIISVETSGVTVTEGGTLRSGNIQIHQ